MKHVRQPNSYTCAPACVAIVTGVSLDELIAEMKPTPKCGTQHVKIVRALRTRGIRCDDRFRSVRGRPLPDTAIIRITHKDKRIGHVVVKRGRTWFDPNLDEPFTGDPVLTMSGSRIWVDSSRITSALWIGDGMP